MYDDRMRAAALRMLAAGASPSEVSRRLGPSRWVIRDWRDRPDRPRQSRCFRCHDLHPAIATVYSALLGFYLGDGCVSSFRGKWMFRVSCDATWPGIIEDVGALVAAISPTGVHRVRGPGVIVVTNHWKHWPCLFPQHGPGRKHERPIVLEAWQRDVVDAFPGDLLRGLFHSDGCRVRNWATRTVGGERKRYDYPRWQFSNASEDILGLCTDALDRLGIAWRRSGPRVVSVSRREAVAVLDRTIGPKS